MRPKKNLIKRKLYIRRKIRKSIERITPFSRQLAKILARPLISLGLVLFSFVMFSYYDADASPGELSLANVISPVVGGSQGGLFLSDENYTMDSAEPVAVAGCLKAGGPVTVAQTQTFGSLGGDVERGSATDKEILEYRVQPGDTLSSIAESFDISLNTVLWANDLSRNSTISVGQKLSILPVSGVTHLVKKGESVSYLAEAYGAEADKIREFNNLPEDDKIVVGDLLILPGGEPSRSSAPSSTSSPSSPSRAPSSPGSPAHSPLATGYFICPVPSPCNVTQGLHWYNAIDFSNGVCGQPVFAAAGGEVQKTGFDPYAGNYVRILHPNGVVTFYGHFSKYVVTPGQKVNQGQIIGYIGNTGRTIGRTGCHVHFEVRGARNPFAY